MAVLSVPQIQEVLRNKKVSSHAKELADASKHDNRLAFHTQPTINISELKYLGTFKEFVQRILNKDKFQVFEHLLTIPLDTVEILEGIIKELQKVFEASNKYIKYSFTNSELEQDFNDYRQQINDYMFWPTTGFNIMKSDVNSFVIVDLPIIQLSDRPEPYYYTITPDMVYNVEANSDGTLQYIMFQQGDHIYVFDDLYYRSFDLKGNLITESNHGLGYTPARCFWSTPYNNKSKLLKQNVISKSLSQLDWLLYSIVSKKHLSTYAGFPIFVAYEQKCNYEDEHGNACNNGTITNRVRLGGEGGEMRTVVTDCPKCSESRKIMGAGTFLKAPAPRDNEDPNLLEGVKIIGADTNSLDWMAKDVDSQISWITYNIIGIPDEVSAQAINEKQVTSQFESRMNVFLNVKSNFEAIQKWTLDTVAKLRYGSAFTESTVSYGDKFFMHTAEEIEKNYIEAKNGGAPMYELAARRKQIYETKYKNNVEMRERMDILSAIEPYPDLSLKELFEIAKELTVSPVDMQLKANFDSYVQRFERENVPVNMYMQFSDGDTKITMMREIMRSYAEEDIAEAEESAPEPPPPTIPPGGAPPIPGTGEGAGGAEPPKPGE